MATYTARRLPLFVGFLIVALLLPAVASAADDAAGLLAKHKAFVGWQLGDGTFSTLKYTTTETRKEKTTATIVRAFAGLAYRSTVHDTKRDIVTSDDGFTGHIFWETNENGFTHPVYGDEAKYVMARNVLFNEGTTLLDGTSRGTATVDGKATDIVRVALKNGDAIDLYEDPQTGAYVKAVIDPDGLYETSIHFGDYTTLAPGKKYIGTYWFEGDSSRFSNGDFVVNPTLAESDLHPPAPVATWAFNNPNPFPFKVTDDRFSVTAKVNGVEGHFVLDTGAAGIVLTKSFADKVHAKAVGNSTGYGIGGSVSERIVKLDSVEIGGNVLSNVYANSADIHIDDKAPDGLMGYDVMGGAIVKLDTSNQTMQILDPSTDISSTQGIPVSVDLTQLIPTVPMKIDNKIDVNATLDTGNFFYVLMSPKLQTRYGLVMLVDDSVEGVLQSHPVMGGVGGYEIGRCGHIDTLSLGPITYQNGPACFSPSFDGRDVLVGFDYLKHFDYVFDYPHGRIIMEPHKNDQ